MGARWPWPLLGAMLIGCIAPAAAETRLAVAQLVVNTEVRGDHFIIVDEPEWFIALADLPAIGLTRSFGERRYYRGAAYVSLLGIPRVRATLDTAAWIVRIEVDPTLLEPQHLSVNRDVAPVAPDYTTSAFFNYRFAREGTASRGWNTVNTEFGSRIGRSLFVQQLDYTATPWGAALHRGDSTGIFDWYGQRTQIVGGDFTVGGNELAPFVRLGGIGVRRAYQMEPGMGLAPAARWEGIVPLAGTLEVEVDGNRVYSAPVKPGPVELDNLTRFAGLRQVDIILRDLTGQVVARSSTPVYWTEQLLAAGLDDFEYALGFGRTDENGKPYTGRVIVARHRFGVTDRLTLGMHAESVEKRRSGGVDYGVSLGNCGVVTGEVAVARKGSRSLAPGAVLHYSYQRSAFGAFAGFEWLHSGFWPTPLVSPAMVQRDAIAGVSVASPRNGSITMSGHYSRYSDGTRSRGLAWFYTVTPMPRWSLTASVGVTRHPASGGIGGGVTASLNVTYFFGRRGSAGLQFQRQPGRGVDSSLQVSEPAPEGEGAGYRVDVEHIDRATLLRSSIQFNTASNIFEARISEALGPFPHSTAYDVSAAGAVVYAGGTLALARPVQDGFAIVKVGDVDNVPVYQNGQDVAHTDSRGIAVVPNLGSYFINQVSIDDRQIPLTIGLPNASFSVVPAYRGGAWIDVGAESQRAVTGVLMWHEAGQRRPLGGVDGTLAGTSGAVQLFTASNGELWIENAKPGHYHGIVAVGIERCAVSIEIPPSSAPVQNLGEVLCDRVH